MNDYITPLSQWTDDMIEEEFLKCIEMAYNPGMSVRERVSARVAWDLAIQLAKALPPDPVPVKLRPMSEAPRDGTRILVGCINGSFSTVHWSILHNHWDLSTHPHCSVSASYLSGWLPLPEIEEEEVETDESS